ncbi:putative major facilitator superfamily [Phaeomoniella chlamydospora]|uniref:Putative major facilitator superfamily n=1 Tax=Phaeomoniella chlamydospora TaxID=158046 RepID=A0A0G2DWP6_PHACM|nr:putative major facilitator superfamily [Phaeomoniella chlamydospora]
MNLTLTTYMIFQGLAPSLMGDLADTAGRRPAYLLCLIIYIAACIGLALQNSYAALLVLRCLQSAGSSATLALASGIVGDISTAAERGTYQGIATIGVGGTFSLLVGILVAFSPVLWILYFKGMMLRQKRFARMTEKERTKDADLDNDLNIQHHDENIRGENDGTTAPVAIGGLMEVEGLREVEKEIQDDIEADGKDGR